MSDWEVPDIPDPALRDDAGWRPVGGAFVASAVVHALAIAAIAAILMREPAAATIRPDPPAIQALLVSPVPVAEAPRPAVRAAPEPPRPRPPIVKPAPVQAPWAAEPVDTSPPVWMYSRPMISEGVVLAETRNIAILGEPIERAIQERYPGEPEFPVVLKPAEAIGYPLDLLEAGLEGRVFVWFGVDEEGAIVEGEVLDGPPELTDWVLDRLARLVEKPARNGDKPTRGWVALEIEFSRDAARAARDIRAAERERLERTEMRAKARESP